MKYILQQPGRSIYKLEQSILKIFKFSKDYRAGPDNVLVCLFFIFGEKMIQSAAIEQGRSANRKHT